MDTEMECWRVDREKCPIPYYLPVKYFSREAALAEYSERFPNDKMVSIRLAVAVNGG